VKRKGRRRIPGWLLAVALVHLVPGIMGLSLALLFLVLGGLGYALSAEPAWARIFGVAGAVLAVLPLAVSLPVFLVGLGLVLRRTWGRTTGIFLAGTALVTGAAMLFGSGRALAPLPLVYAALVLGVLLRPRIASTFRDPDGT
jgi:hypothetical protein